jgi:hypothetical protein
METKRIALFFGEICFNGGGWGTLMQWRIKNLNSNLVDFSEISKGVVAWCSQHFLRLLKALTFFNKTDFLLSEFSIYWWSFVGWQFTLTLNKTHTPQCCWVTWLAFNPRLWHYFVPSRNNSRVAHAAPGRTRRSRPLVPHSGHLCFPCLPIRAYWSDRVCCRNGRRDPAALCGVPRNGNHIQWY